MGTEDKILWNPCVPMHQVRSNKARWKEEWACYLRALWNDRQVANIVPTSQSAVRNLCDKIDFSKKLIAIEYGAGTGVFSRYLLERMTDDSLLVLIERNKILHDYLSSLKDSRVILSHDSAENILDILTTHEITDVDYIICGLPLSFFEQNQKRQILRVSHQILKFGGKLLAYQTFNHLKKPLQLYFRFVQVTFEIRNLPPLFIYEATK
jgi:phosphatidylethanolamine/phosphatidyl-N-methylethanolamine N-methyltransferase